MAEGQPRVRRTKTTELRALGAGSYHLTARLTDVSFGGDYGEAWDSDRQTIHDFAVEMDLEGPELSIRALDMSADAHPYRQCPAVLPACQALVGCSLTRGWRAAVVDRLGGSAGCTHVSTLLIGLAEARTMFLFMDFNELLPSNPETHEDGSWTAIGLQRAPGLRNACHTLREDGPVILAGQQHLADPAPPPLSRKEREGA